MLRIEIRSVPPAVHLLCSGRIVLGVEAETLRCMATSRPERWVVLDLQQVCAIDAAGLGLLVELHCRAQERDSVLMIANPAPCVRQLIALTNLESVLEVSYDTAIGLANPEGGERRAMTA